jgi:uncharacterized protein
VQFHIQKKYKTPRRLKPKGADYETDSRGTWKSGGDVVLGGTQEGEDGYDIVEWIAQQSWCNGKVSMAGNSYLAQTQWFVGTQKPPSLACLAPWEGWSDVYNDCVRRGGPFSHSCLERCE